MTPVRMAHPLRASDRRHPIDSWSRDATIVLFAIAVLLLLAGLATLLAPVAS
jgi:hypothetical protein